MSDETPTAEALLATLIGARVDKAACCDGTGLVVLSLFLQGTREYLAVGVGPDVAGVGLASSAPRVRDAASTQRMSALRAYIVDHRVHAVAIEPDGSLSVTVGAAGVFSSVGFFPSRKSGAIVVRNPEGRSIFLGAPLDASEDLHGWIAKDLRSEGDRLVVRSDGAVLDRARAALLKAVRTAHLAAKRRAEAIEGDLSRLEDVGRLQKIGRLLLAQGPKVARGASKATLQDWEEGGEIEVALDPSKPAKMQAETFFAKARRYQRGEQVMRKRLAEAAASVERLEALRSEFEATREWTYALVDAAIVKARSAGVRVAIESAKQASVKRDGDAPRAPYHRYRDERARVIFVGRGGKDNDALTTRVAKPHDLWLHVRGVVGAHVVVPLDKGKTCSAETLVDAATLAAHFSDARDEELCEVTYVLRKHVRKPKGSAPGAVVYDHEKVLALRRDPGRVERLLASREEP